jgi:hypothetical protein
MKTEQDGTVFKFRNLEITLETLVMHFCNDKTVIPLTEIKSYRLDWLLPDSTFVRQLWFLFLTIELENGEKKSGPVAFVNFDDLGGNCQSRHRIERALADAIDCAIARTAAPSQKMICA